MGDSDRQMPKATTARMASASHPRVPAALAFWSKVEGHGTYSCRPLPSASSQVLLFALTAALVSGCHRSRTTSATRLIDLLPEARELPEPPPDVFLARMEGAPPASDGSPYVVPFDVEPGRVVLLRARLSLDGGTPSVELRALTSEQASQVGASSRTWPGELPGQSLGECTRADSPGEAGVDCQRLVEVPPLVRRAVAIVRRGSVSELTVREARLEDPRAPESPRIARLLERARGQTETGQSWRSALVARPGSRYRFELSLPEEAELWLGAGYEAGDDAATEWFRVTQDGRVLLNEAISPDGKWHDFHLKLAGTRGHLSEVALETAGAAGKGRGLWTDPRLFGRSELPNILLVTLDAVRPDHTSAYGYARDTTPALAQLAKLGALFDRATAQAGSTWDSIPSLLSGSYPAHDGVRALGVPWPPDLVLLPDLLARAGYDTFAGSDLALFPAGYLNGFDDAEQARLVVDEKISPAQQFRRLSAQLGHRPTFAWFHIERAHYPLLPRRPELFDPGYRGRFERTFTLDDHDHFTSPGALTPAERTHVAALYDAEVRQADDELKGLLTVLNESGHWEHTIVVVAADHGERIAEHGAVLEHTSPYDAVLHVPLLFEWEGHVRAGLRVQPRVELTDVVPTLLDLAGLKIPGDLDGRSLAGALSGGPLPERPAYAEVLQLFSQYRQDEHVIVNAADLPANPSLTPRCELYDIRADPEEKQDLAATESARAQDAAGALANQIRAWRAGGGGATSLGQGALEALRQAGYLPKNANEAAP
jgi:arylsulfatase